MSEINKAFVQQFNANLLHLAQQKGSRLMRAVKVKPIVGKSSHFDRLGATVAQKRTSRHGDTPLIDTPHSRRRVQIEDWEWADLIDDQDQLRMLINPTSDYMKAGAWSIGRAIDHEIIRAFDASSISVAADDTTSNVAFDSAMLIDNDFDTGNSGLIPEKVIEARRLLRGNDIDMDEPMYLVCNADQLAQLMSDADVKSIDFNSHKPLVDGELPRWGGFDIIHTEQVTAQEGTTGVADTDPDHAYAFTQSAIGLAMAKDISTRISERDDKSYATQVYACASFGAVRIEEEKIVKIETVR